MFRLWEALRGGEGALVTAAPPSNIKYVEDGLAHLLQGAFAPRTLNESETVARELKIGVRSAENEQFPTIDVVVPDLKGELWQTAVETGELPEQWMNLLNASSGAFLFLRVLSEQNVAPLDWITAERLLRLQEVDHAEANVIPTQVALCELLRFLEITLKPTPSGNRPRVAVIITAWDLLDAESADAGPEAYLEKEYPLFAGRLKDALNVDVQVFGLSVVGGDFDDLDFRDQFFRNGIKNAGYVAFDIDSGVERKPDVTIPISWVVGTQQIGR